MFTSHEIVQNHRFQNSEIKSHIDQQCFGQSYLLISHIKNKQERLYLENKTYYLFSINYYIH